MLHDIGYGHPATGFHPLGGGVAFLRSVADHRLYGLFAVGVALGLRKGELLALRWADVDLDGALLHVRQNVLRLPEASLVFGPPKSASSGG